MREKMEDAGRDFSPTEVFNEALEMFGGKVAADRGPWLQTYSGRRFYPLDPREDEVWLPDIAHALANICRFNGHSTRFYSVAEHSLLVAKNVPMHLRAWALLHDAAEAYVCDVARPLKQAPQMGFYREMEDRILATIYRRFELLAPGAPLWIPEQVKVADRNALATERRDLMVRCEMEWDLGSSVPFECRIPAGSRFKDLVEVEFMEMAGFLGLAG